jgi:hypothetical protein
MPSQIEKDLAIIDELQASVKLIELGLGEFQSLNMGNDFYFLPFQLLSSGYERLMKCLVCLRHFDKTGEYPDTKFLRNDLGHWLPDILNYTTQNNFVLKETPALQDDLNFLTKDEDLPEIVRLLGEFGRRSRYYNLDVVTGTHVSTIDVKAEWEAFENRFYINDETFLGRLANPEQTEDAIAEINRHSVILLERWARAIGRQFTFSEGDKVRSLSSIVSSFAALSDEQLGTTDYRDRSRSLRNFNSTSSGTISLRDTLRRLLCKDVAVKKVHRSEYKGDWPFLTDSIEIECRHKHWCVVIINARQYALNGLASQRYKLSFPHDEGQAILGKSLSPFIDMALDMGKQ